MLKNYINKRKKYTTSTYMREALDYQITIIKEEDYFVTIKKYIKLSDDFCITDENGNNTKYISNGYYLIEVTPIKENYNIRFYYDKNKKLIDYYIDITLENGVENKIPYYIDLYLDIIHYPENDSVGYIDEDELKDALNNKIISRSDYLLAYKVGEKLLKEIKNKSNKYLNMNIKKYLKKIS